MHPFFNLMGSRIMQRELLILRHAKSDWGIETDDFNRPLKKKGKKAALRMGLWLKQEDIIPDCIITSPAVRALKTAEWVCEAMAINRRSVIKDSRVYDAEVASLLLVLAEHSKAYRRVLLVGHNPDLEALLTYLVEKVDVPPDGKLFATATLARLRMPDDWTGLTRSSANLLSLVRAADLRSDDGPD
jgi:phosphohistidine phosphatase